MPNITGQISRAQELTGSTSGNNRMSGQIQGIRGEKGDKGDKGDTGATGVGIASTVLNSDYTLTIVLTDGTSYTTPPIRGAQGQQGVQGEQGIQGVQGETGNGISSIAKTGTSGLVDTYTITFTDGTTMTFTITNGRNGTGSVADVWQNGVSVLDGSTAKIVADANVQSDWNESDTIDDAYIKNKPTNVSAFTNDAGYVKSTDLATVATTGDYEDLSNTPTDISVFNNDVGYIRAPETYAADANKDINDYTFTGIYRGYNPSANTPNNYSGSYVVVVYRYSADWLAQMYIDIGTGSVYTRTWKSGNSWTSWSPSNGVLVLSVASFSSLPQTVYDTRITSNMVCIKAELGTPSAQTGDWTVTTTNGSVTISGSISGSTTATLYLTAAQ